jgi:hypothetical protein
MSNNVGQIALGLARVVQLCSQIRVFYKNGREEIAKKLSQLRYEANNISNGLSALGSSGQPQSDDDIDAEWLQDMTQQTQDCIKFLEDLLFEIIEQRRAGLMIAAKYVFENEKKVERFREELLSIATHLSFHISGVLLR